MRGITSRKLIARLDVLIITLFVIVGMMVAGMMNEAEHTVTIKEIKVQMPVGLFEPKPKPKPKPYTQKFNISEAMAIKIIFYSDKHGVPTDLAFGLIEVESGFNRFAVSKSGARGLTQLLRSTAGDYVSNPTDSLLFDVDANLDTGMLYMRLMLDRFDNVSTALEAYNRGPNRVGRMLRDGVPFHRNYSRTVLAVAERMAD